MNIVLGGKISSRSVVGGAQNTPHEVSIEYNNLVTAETGMYTCAGGAASRRVSYTDVDGYAASWYANTQRSWMPVPVR